jgi:transmembrane sensor
MNAARWFARLKAAPVTAPLDGKFQRWLAADPAREVEYERQELTWELAGELAEDQEIAQLVAEAQQSAAKARERTRWPFIAWSIAVAAALALLAVGIGIQLQSRSVGETYVTAIGEQRTVVLPDESRIVLNTSTRARVLFKRNARIVELDQGEATFSVAHDPTRPFEVKAASGTTRALGTEFNVLSHSEGVTVSVLEGRVEVTSSGAGRADPRSVRLGRGQEVTYQNAHLSDVRIANADRIQAWHAGRIAFEDVRLEQALAEFNRYTQVPVVLRDSSLSELRVTGLFRIGETDAFLRALDAAFDIRAERDDQTIELARPAASP